MEVIKKQDFIEDLMIQIPIAQAVENNTVEAIPIPQDATNEDALKAVFPKDAEDIIKYIKTAILNGWLNSKYEEKKNNEN